VVAISRCFKAQNTGSSWKLSGHDLGGADRLRELVGRADRAGDPILLPTPIRTAQRQRQPAGTKAGLLVLDALTGKLLRSIPLPITYSAGRGLGGVTLERDARRRIVAAYAGDANGNLWRFDLRGAVNDWKVSYGKPLFTTTNNRPIYAAPAWQPHPKGGNIVVFATGMVLEDGDLADTTKREAVYGIWDPTSRAGVEKVGFETVRMDALLEQRLLRQEMSSGGKQGFSLSRNQIDWTQHRGWQLGLEFASGERAIDQIRRLGSSVEINTVTLDSSASTDVENCTPTNLPKNPVYVLNTLDGSGKPAFDLDSDGTVDNVSMVVSEAGGYSRGVRLINFSNDHSGILEHHGEGDPKSSGGCKGAKFSLVGLLNGTLSGETSCNDPSDPLGTRKPWSRQQYQLVRPPL